MSNSINIEKSISVEVQIDFVKCSCCSAELDVNIETDNFGDIQIYVDKCECSDE